MTLADLLEAATPGPWVLTEPEDSWHFKLASIICLGTSGSDDLDLAALAPDLARLALDMGEALRQAIDCKGPYEGTVRERGGEPAICPRCADEVRALLARLDGIGNKDGAA